MATVLRVRRKRTCDPVEALVLSCKRAKSDLGSGGGAASAAAVDGDVKKVFKLVGTVDKKDQPIATQIQTHISKAQPSKQKTKSSSTKTKPSKTVKEKLRSLHDAAIQSGRYTVVSSHRGLKLQELDSQPNLQTNSQTKTTIANGTVSSSKPDVAVKPQHRNRPTSLLMKRVSKKSKQKQAEIEARQLFSFFDLEHQDESGKGATTKTAKTKSSDPDVILCNNVQMICEKLVLDDNTIPDSEYVYDLYYIDDEQVDPEMKEGATIGMHHADKDNELVYDFFPSDTANTMFAEDDDDSNEEGNWRNDYPDEDPDKRHPDLFDELLDDYNYGEMSSDDDLNYGEDNMDYRHRAINKLDLDYCDKSSSGSDLDEYAF